MSNTRIRAWSLFVCGKFFAVQFSRKLGTRRRIQFPSPPCKSPSCCNRQPCYPTHGLEMQVARYKSVYSFLNHARRIYMCYTTSYIPVFVAFWHRTQMTSDLPVSFKQTNTKFSLSPFSVYFSLIWLKYKDFWVQMDADLYRYLGW